jgi:hypothetical protein
MLVLSRISTSARGGRPRTAAITAAILVMLLSCTTIPALAGMISPSPNMPPENGVYAAQDWIVYANGVFLRNVTLSHFTASYSPPAPGNTVVHSFGALLDCDVSWDAGLTWSHSSAPATETVKTFADYSGVYEEEMFGLDISGGSLPAGVMIRESPFLHSDGETTIDPVGDDYRIDSFFDVFTELSLDSGMSWQTSDGSTRVELTPEPSSFIVLFAGVLGLAGMRRRRA